MSAPVTAPPQESTPSFSQAPVPWAMIGWFTFLLAISYTPMFLRLVENWETDEDMGHGFFVIPIAIWVAWRRRDRLQGLFPHGNSWGLALVVLGMVQLFIGTLGAEVFLQRTAFLVSLSGVIICLVGWPGMRALAFPVFLLFFMISIPQVIYNQLTLPLQLFASMVAENVLNFIGIPTLREGNVLELASQKLSVVEACSGIRSLISLAFLSLVYGYYFDDKRWMRPVLLVLTVPIAIFTNAARVTITGIVSEWKKEFAEGLFHSMEGWVIFMMALVLLFSVHQIVNWLYYGIKGARQHAAVSA
jgi:exosortase